MGSLSLVDDCIVLMVEAGATRLTVHGMREHANRPEHVASAIELISNFGAIEDDELDEQMTAYLIEEGGLDAILDVMKTYDTSVPILLIGFEALYNIGNDGDAAQKLVELGVVQQSFTVLQNFDYERKLVAQVMKFLSVLTYNDSAVEVIAEDHLLPIVFHFRINGWRMGRWERRLHLALMGLSLGLTLVVGKVDLDEWFASLRTNASAGGEQAA